MSDFLRKNTDQRYTLGVVYAPDVLDTDEEFAKAETIEKAAWDFMSDLQKDTGVYVDQDGLDDGHKQVRKRVGTIVESYVAPVDMEIDGETVTKGTWLLGVVWNEDMFKLVKSGERTGLSMYGRATRVAGDPE